MKSRTGSIFATIILLAIVIFLAVDVGFSLYQPNRLTSSLPVCTLNIISGDIKVQTKDTLTWEKANDGMILEPGSRVRTDSDSHASLTFSQGTTTKLEPGTDLIVAKLEGDQATQPDAIVLEQRLGKTWNQVAAQPDSNYQFQIKTSSADVKVRGTLFATEVDESGKTIIQTSEGQVSVSAEGQEVQVYAGQQTEVEPGAAPSVPEPMPPARNELVLTINEPAVGLIIDPSGSSTGYLPDGTPLNQISGSQLTPSEEPYHTIRIREPHTGDYAIVLRGIFDGETSFSVGGFTEGQNTFLHMESCNITSANEMILKLHLDVLDGLLQATPVLNLESSEEPPMATMLKTSTKETKPDASSQTPAESDMEMPDTSKKGEASGQESTWFRPEIGFKYDLWVAIAFISALISVVSIFILRKH